MNIYDSVESNSKKHLKKTALVYATRRISYKSFLEHVNRTASGFRNLGLKKGDRVAFLMHNCPEFVVCFYAAMKLGLITVSLNIMFRKDEVNYILRDCEPKAMIAHDNYLSFLESIEKHQNGSMKVVSISPNGNNIKGTLSFESFLKNTENEIPTVDLRDEDIAVIGYTSGTTGFPKGAAHTHKNILAHLEGISCHLGYNSQDVILAALPFFQLVAFITHACVSFHVGGKLVIHEKFEPATFLDAVKQERVTYFSGVPTLYQMIYSVSREQDVDFSSVRFGICAGSPLSLDLRAKFENSFNFRIIHCYGLTEISLIAACESLDFSAKGVSVGHVLPYIRLRLVKENGRPVAAGEDGEIQIHAERALKFYWNKPEETKEALDGGWFKTGDVGCFDDDGHLHIVDRKKDMIIRGGFNVYPVELERVLLQDPRIREAVVIGIPHDRLGEVPKAYVVPEEGSTIILDDVLEISRIRTANYKAIEAVEIVDASFFPRTALGKVMKAELKKQT